MDPTVTRPGTWLVTKSPYWIKLYKYSTQPPY